MPNSILQQLDLTVCFIHSHFNLSSKKQTERIICAMDNPYFTILRHPTGRLIEKCADYSLDMEQVMQAAAVRGRFLEINEQPERLNLNEIYCKMAKERGVKLVI